MLKRLTPGSLPSPRARIRAAVAAAFVGLFAIAHLTSGLRAAATGLFTYSSLIGGVMGPGPGELKYPTDVAIGPQDRIYVADSGNDRIQIFNKDGTFYAQFGSTGSLPGQFMYPSGVVVDRAGNILVTEAENNRVQLFDKNLQFVKSFGIYHNYDPLFPPYEPVPTLTGLNFPTRAALLPGTVLNVPSPTGRVAIVDSGNHRVIVLDSQLNPLFAFGPLSADYNKLGELDIPWGIGMDAQHIYVADPANHRIQVFDSAGTPQYGFGSINAANSPHDLESPFDVQPDGHGNLIVSDTTRSRVLFLTPDPLADRTIGCSNLAGAAAAGRCAIVATDGTVFDTQVIGGFTPSGNELGKFSHPQGAVMDSKGRLVVVDTDGHRVEIFRAAHLTVGPVSLSTLGPVQSGRSVTVNVTVANDGASELVVSPVVSPSLTGTLTTPAGAFMSPGTSFTFAVTFVTDANGALNFTVKASGQPTIGRAVLSAPVTAGPITVIPAPGPKMSLSVVATPTRVGIGSPIQVQVAVSNTGTSDLTAVAPVVDVTPAGLVSLRSSAPAPTTPLLAGASRTYTFTYNSSAAGVATFTARASANYADLTPPGSVRLLSTPIGSQPSASVTIDSDVEPPKTTIVTISPSPAPSGWYLGPVHLVLAATDNTAVAAINYSVTSSIGFSGRTVGANAVVDITRDGYADLTYYAEDVAHNVEAPHTKHFDIDSVAPTIAGATPAPAPNAAGWINQFPTVSFIATDYGSGLDTITPPPRVTTDGPGQAVTGTARDVAGNSAQAQVTVNVDTKAPALVCAPTTVPTGLNGWYTRPEAVTVTCIAVDQPQLSGILRVNAICPSNIGTTNITPTGTAAFTTGPLTASASCTVPAEGIFTVHGEAKDVAGNLTVGPLLTIKIDRTPPVLACRVSSAPIAWPRDDRMVAWNPVVTATDAVSSATFKLVAFYSNEQGDGDQDGSQPKMTGWTLNTPDTSGFIYAERNDPARVYTLKYLATDLAGNTATCYLSVTVPRANGTQEQKDRDERTHDGTYCDDKSHQHER